MAPTLEKTGLDDHADEWQASLARTAEESNHYWQSIVVPHVGSAAARSGHVDFAQILGIPRGVQRVVVAQGGPLLLLFVIRERSVRKKYWTSQDAQIW